MSRVLLISDLHIGNNTDIELLTKLATKYWKGESILLLGDLIDCGIDRGMEFSNDNNPQDQIDQVDELFRNLYVKGYVTGNHESRIFKKTGLNPFKKIFGMNPKHDYEIDGRRIYINHGKSTAQNSFLEHTKYAQWLNVDVIALGHSHFLGKETRLKDGKLIHYVRTGSLLKTATYASQAGYAPQLMGWIEYNTQTNYVSLKAVYNGEVIEI